MTGLFAVVGVVVVLAILLFVVRRGPKRPDPAEIHLRLGFSPGPDDAAHLEAVIGEMEGHDRYRYEVLEPMRRGEGTDALYRYVLIRTRGGDSDPSEEYLFSLKRPSEEGLLFLIRPPMLPEGLATKLIEKLFDGSWDKTPAGLAKLEIPPDGQDRPVLAILGAPGYGLWELIEPEAMDQLQGLGEHGVLAVFCRGGYCRLSCPGRHAPPRAESIVQTITSLTE